MTSILETLYSSLLDSSSSPVNDVVHRRLGDDDLGCGLLESSVGVGLVPFEQRREFKKPCQNER